MSWNIELALIPYTTGEDPGLYVPDVFGPTSRTVHFEDATSSSMMPALCAAVIDGYVVVIDTGCRLTGINHYLNAIDAAASSAFIFRIADTPIELVIQDGQEVNRSEGDDEDTARAAIENRTGLEFPFGFWSVEYMVFEPDL